MVIHEDSALPAALLLTAPQVMAVQTQFPQAHTHSGYSPLGLSSIGIRFILQGTLCETRNKWVEV